MPLELEFWYGYLLSLDAFLHRHITELSQSSRTLICKSMSFPTKLSFVPKLNFYKNLKPPSRYLFPLPPPYGGIKNQMGPKLIFYKNLKPPSRYLSPLPPPFGGIKNQRGYFFSSLYPFSKCSRTNNTYKFLFFLSSTQTEEKRETRGIIRSVQREKEL